MLRIGTFDRSGDPANHLYDYSLATRDRRRSLTFRAQSSRPRMSDPTQDDRWFAGTTLNPAFPFATTFLGDYSNIAVVPGRRRRRVLDRHASAQRASPAAAGTGEDAYFAYRS